MEISDIRQSANWSDYLAMYNWKSETLSNGSVIRFMKFGFLNFAKLQRPGLLNEDILLEIEQLCRKRKVVDITIFPSKHQDEKSLVRAKYKKVKKTDTPSKTMIINLEKDIEELNSNLSKSCKYSINRANREGNTTEFIRNPSIDHINVFHKLVTERGKKKKFFVQSLHDYQTKIKIFGDESYLANVFDKNGNILGAKLFLGFDRNIWYIHGGTSEKGQHSKAGYKLMQDAICFFKGQNYKNLDLEGLFDERMERETKGWQGYTHFKNKFGGDIVEYPLPYSRKILRNAII